MSLILEALRKSEAERRLGHAPGLLTPMAPYRRARRRPWRWIAGMLLVAALAGSAWWIGRHGSAPAPVISDMAAPAAPEPPVAAVDPPKVGVDRAPSAPAAIAAPTPTAPAAPVPVVPAGEPVVAELPAPPPPPLPEPEPQPSPVATTAAPPADIRAELVPVQDMPRIDQLGAVVRSGLPPLKVTMHVYAKQPDRRIVILDGRRYVEGDAVTAGLSVREIRRDGVVLEHAGGMFLLPSR